MPNWSILQGDALSMLRLLPKESVQCVVTSPPYYSARDYGIPGMIWPAVSYEPMAGLGINLEFPCDPDCDHVWDSDRVVAEIRTGKGLADLGKQYRGGGHKQGQIATIDQERSTCSKCGAWKGCLGFEPSPEMYVAHLVAIFREVKRVLRPDGVCWLNLGDSYWGGKGRSGHGSKAYQAARRENGASLSNPQAHVGGPGKIRPNDGRHPGLKPKDMIGIPWRTAMALQADGWYLRSDVIWFKTNPPPESVTDRPVKSHEYIFLLTKDRRNFYDQTAIREKPAASSLERISQSTFHKQTGGEKDYGRTGIARHRSSRKTLEGFAKNPGRNKRTVWKMSVHTFAGKHYATFPEKLPTTCIKASVSKAGCCPLCRKPYKRVMKQIRESSWARRRKDGHKAGYQTESMAQRGQGSLSDPADRQAGGFGVPSLNIPQGWEPDCDCQTSADPVPCLVLDPFHGAGTTGMVAQRWNCDFIGIEPNPKYIDIARKRIQDDSPLWNMANESKYRRKP